jgi:hypothetical protein
MDGRRVIVRDFLGEPHDLVAISVGDRLVYVANPLLVDRVKSGDSSAVGFPKGDVYHFEKSVFLAIRDEWKQNQATDKWKELRPFCQ